MCVSSNSDDRRHPHHLTGGEYRRRLVLITAQSCQPPQYRIGIGLIGLQRSGQIQRACLIDYCRGWADPTRSEQCSRSGTSVLLRYVFS